MNKVILHGFTGKEPEVKSFDWGKVCKFSLATSESYKNKQGERITDTEWHTCVFKGSIVEVIEKYVKKGQELIVEGKNVTRQWEDKAGVKHYTTEVVCHSFEFCGTKEKVEQPKNNEGEWQGKKEVGAMSDVSELPGNIATDEENDELRDLPF